MVSQPRTNFFNSARLARGSDRFLYLSAQYLEFLAGFSNAFIISGSPGLSEDRGALQTLNMMEMLSNNLCSLPPPPISSFLKKKKKYINKMETPTVLPDGILG